MKTMTTQEQIQSNGGYTEYGYCECGALCKKSGVLGYAVFVLRHTLKGHQITEIMM